MSFDPNHHTRTLYYLGHHNEVLSATKPPSHDPAPGVNLSPTEIETSYLHIRALIALKKFTEVISAISSHPSPSSQFKAAKILATYLQAKETQQIQTITSSISDMKALMNDIVVSSNPNVRILAAELFLVENLLDDAFKAVNQPAKEKNLECAALLVQIYLRIGRTDLAQIEIQNLTSLSSDSVLVQLVEAWVNIALGGTKIQEAFYAYEELLQTYGSNAHLFTCMAACKLHVGELGEAERFLNEAIAKDPNYGDAIANLYVVSTLQRKPLQNTQQLLEKLIQTDANHQFVLEYRSKGEAFDRASVRYMA